MADADTVKFLEEVKKGKPRRFVMSWHGFRLQYLAVFKKGTFEQRVRDAKQAGPGKQTFGIVEGRGTNITFVLSEEDGFDNAPIKAAQVKKFLGDHADKKYKPDFRIVNRLPAFVEDDDDG